MRTPTKIVEGCTARSRSIKSGLCEKHYYRIRRQGSANISKARKARPVSPHSGGYLLVCVPDHALAKKTSRRQQFQHRVVYFDAHGEGPFACHRCKVEVTWDTLHIDHLNDIKTDNAIDNLVASCAVCNMHRGSQKMKATMQGKGTLITAHGRTMCASQWARELGISPGSIQLRIKRGWSPEAVTSTPRGNHGPKRKSRNEMMESIGR